MGLLKRHKSMGALRGAALACCMALVPLHLHAQVQPDPPPEDIWVVDTGELEKRMGVIENVPQADLSWVTLRAITGETVWDGAANVMPGFSLDAIPGLDDNGQLEIETEEIDSLLRAGRGSGSVATNEGITIASVLRVITEFITSIGVALLIAFGVFFALQQMFGFVRQGQGPGVGWGPARLIVSMLFIMPVQNGLCVIQALVIVCAQIGIGGANFVWNKAVGAFMEDVIGVEETIDENDAERAARHEAFAEDILQLNGWALVQQAMAVGACQGILDTNDPQVCGYIDNDESLLFLEELAQHFTPPGNETVATEVLNQLKPVHDARKDMLQGILARTRDVFNKDPATNLLGGQVSGEVIREHIHDLSSVQLAHVGIGENNPNKGKPVILAHTQAIWNSIELLLLNDEDASGVAQCIASWWASPDSGDEVLGITPTNKGQKMADALAAGADPNNPLGGIPSRPDPLNQYDLANKPLRTAEIWPLNGFSRGLANWGRGNENPCPLLETPSAPGGIPTPTYTAGILNNIAALNVDMQGLGQNIESLYRSQLAPVTREANATSGRGWLMAGSLYWQIQLARRTSRSLQQSTIPTIHSPPVDINKCQDLVYGIRELEAEEGLWAGVKKWWRRSEDRRNTAQYDSAQTETYSGVGVSASLNHKCRGLAAWTLGGMLAEVLRSASEPIEGRENRPAPLYMAEIKAVDANDDARVAQFIVEILSNSLTDVAENNAPLYDALDYGNGFLGYGLVIIGVGGVTEWLGSGVAIFTSAAGGRFIGSLVSDFGAAVQTVGWGITLIGVLLTIWLPAMPLIAWLMSAWAWLVSVVLALLAAPLWALAHAVPDGHGPLSPYSRKGYELLLFTTLRPVLLVTGLLLAMVLAGFICKIGAVLFSAAIEGYKTAALTTTTRGDILANLTVAGMALLLWLVIIWLITETFQLCHQLADRVFEWIGSGAQSLGDSQMISSGKAWVGGIAAGAAARGRQIAAKPGTGVTDRARAYKAEKDRAKESGNQYGGAGTQNQMRYPYSG